MTNVMILLRRRGWDALSYLLKTSFVFCPGSDDDGALSSFGKQLTRHPTLATGATVVVVVVVPILLMMRIIIPSRRSWTPGKMRCVDCNGGGWT